MSDQSKDIELGLDGPEKPTGQYEGWFSRILCSECELTFDYEDDPSNGQEVECPDCHATLIVEGR